MNKMLAHAQVVQLSKQQLLLFHELEALAWILHKPFWR